jgi:hypothetical protein
MARSSIPAGGYLTRKSYKTDLLDEAGDITGKKKKKKPAPKQRPKKSKKQKMKNGNSYTME